MPAANEMVEYQSLAGSPAPFEAVVLEVAERGGETILTLDVLIDGRTALRRHLVPWSDDPACRERGWAHPKEISA